METTGRGRRAQLSPASSHPSMNEHRISQGWTLRSEQPPAEYRQSDPSGCPMEQRGPPGEPCSNFLTHKIVRHSEIFSDLSCEVLE